jgi:uncharacterized protein with HEPN domain
MTAKRNDALRTSDMLLSLERLHEVLAAGYEPFKNSWQSQSATIRELEILGEAAGGISRELRRRHPELEWSRMRGFSSFAKHEYWRIKPELVWGALAELPAVRDRLKRVVPRA